MIRTSWLAVLIAASNVFGQTDADWKTVIYPVNNLLVRSADQPLPGGPGFAATSPGRQHAPTIDQLAEAIERTVDPDRWANLGGPGRIAVVGESLLIHNTAAVHQQVQQLLQALAGGEETRLRITVHWLFVPVDRYLEWTKLPVKEEGNAGRQEVLADWIANVPAFRGEVVAANEQTVHLLSGSRQLTVKGVTPMVSASIAAFDPDLYCRNEGLAAQLTPRFHRADGSLTVEVHGYLTAAAANRSATVTPESGFQVPPITRNVTHTTVRAAVGSPVLVSAMTRNPRHGDGDPRVVCLVLQADRIDPPSEEESAK